MHHSQAVEMAVWARNNTADPAVRQLAFDIESTQTSQVGRMEGWLTLWGQPLTPPSGQFMGWMGMPTAAMPGMATPEDLARLRAATGRDARRRVPPAHAAPPPGRAADDAGGAPPRPRCRPSARWRRAW